MKSAWTTKTLEDACRFINGLWKGEKPPCVNVGVIRNTNFTKDGTLDLSDVAYLDVEARKFETRRLQIGDIILEKSGGGPKQPVGRVALFDKEDEEFSFSNFTSALRVLNPRELDFRYVHMFLHWTYLSGVTAGMQSHSTGIRNLDAGAYKSIQISFPVLSEQRRIISILDEAFANIDVATANAVRNSENTQTLFDSYLQSIFTQRGKGWVEKTLGEIAEFKNGLNFTRRSKGQTLRLVGVGDFQDRSIAPMDDLQSVTIDGKLGDDYLIQKNDILTVRSNGSKSLVGRCMLVPDVDEPTSFSGFIIRIRFNTREINPRFLLHFMRSSGTRERLTRSGGGANISNINQVKLSELPIYLPSLKEQDDAAMRLDQLREETQRLASVYERKLAALEALKSSLLHQAFSGELTKRSVQAIVIPFPTKIPSIATTDLHAGILAAAYELHEKNNRQKHFGHVKAEKIAHMVEAHLEIDLDRAPIKDAAGPNDYPHQQKVEHRARKAGYFDFKRVDGAGYQVKKLRQFDTLVNRTRECLADKNKSVDELLELMLPMTTQQAEICATVHAAWNNLLLDGQTPTDEEIVYEARENWHPAKLNIPREKFFAAIDWLKKKSIVPSGKGKKVATKTGKK